MVAFLYCIILLHVEVGKKNVEGLQRVCAYGLDHVRDLDTPYYLVFFVHPNGRLAA